MSLDDNIKCIKWPNGNEEWFNEKHEYHRLDGPAVVRFIVMIWFINGKRHRLDGPAVEYASGTKEWFIKGKEISQQEFEQHPLVIFYRLCKGVV